MAINLFMFLISLINNVQAPKTADSGCIHYAGHHPCRKMSLISRNTLLYNFINNSRAIDSFQAIVVFMFKVTTLSHNFSLSRTIF